MTTPIIEQAMTLLQRGQTSEAIALLEKHVPSFPDEAEPRLLLARLLLKSDPIAALDHLQVAAQLAPDNSESRSTLALALMANDRAAEALEAAHIVAKDEKANAIALDSAADVFEQAALHHEALGLIERAAQLAPDNLAIAFNLARVLKFCGDIAGARTAIEQILRVAPGHILAMGQLSELRKATPEDNQLAAYHHLFSRVQDPGLRLHLAHGAARECEALGRIGEAMTLLKVCKEGLRAQSDYSFEDDARLFDAVRNAFDGVGLPAARSVTENSPLFIVGMPRSGTTLVERMIGAHPDIVPVGESLRFGMELQRIAKQRSNQLIAPESAQDLMQSPQLGDAAQAYLKNLRAIHGSKGKLLDKFHLNILLAGFILTAMPDSRMICMVRGPMDTIVGNYRQIFEFDSGTYRYNLDLESCAHFYVAFRKLADFWQARFPDRFLIVSYEELTRNPMEQGREMFSFCELDWQDGYAFIERNMDAVTTASALQVRQPIHTKSIGQWQNYMPYVTDALTVVEVAGYAP